MTDEEIRIKMRSVCIGDVFETRDMYNMYIRKLTVIESVGERRVPLFAVKDAGSNKMYEISLGGLRPKVIDEQILEAFGFRRMPDSACRNPRQWTMDYGYGGIMRVTETETGWKAEFVDSENCASVRTEHVHELQHLARIIAGVNLTLNP